MGLPDFSAPGVDLVIFGILKGAPWAFVFIFSNSVVIELCELDEDAGVVLLLPGLCEWAVPYTVLASSIPSEKGSSWGLSVPELGLSAPKLGLLAPGLGLLLLPAKALA